MQRMGMVIGLRPAAVADHKSLHAEVWPKSGAKLSLAIDPNQINLFDPDTSERFEPANG